MSTMQGTVTPTTLEPINKTPLRPGHDRCDKCGVEALVRVELRNGGELLFCGHDYRLNEAGLAGVMSAMHDERERLLPKPFDPTTDNC